MTSQPSTSPDLRGRHRAARGDHPAPGLRRGRPARDARPRPARAAARRVLRGRARRGRPGARGAAPRRARRAARGSAPAAAMSDLRRASPDLAAATIDDYALERLQRDVSSDFTRVSTVIRLRGGGEEGVGEDVTYDAADHDVAAGGRARCSRSPGDWTLGVVLRPPRGARPLARAAAARRLASLPPLGLRVGGARPRAAPGRARRCTRSLGREPRPVTFVVSLRLGEPATLEPVRARASSATRRCASSSTRRRDWTTSSIAELAATGAVDSRRLQGPLRGHGRRPAAPTRPSTGASPRRSRTRGSRTRKLDAGDRRGARARTATASPGTRTSTASPTSRRCRSRRRWSTSSRRASAALRELLARLRLLRRARHRHVRRRPVRARRRAAARSSTSPRSSTPTRPNDVAPGGYNDVDPPDGLPSSPLRAARPTPTGFRWDAE